MTRSRPLLVVLAALALVVLAGCTDGGSERGSRPDEASSSTTGAISTTIVEHPDWPGVGAEPVAVPAPPVEPSSTRLTAIPAGLLLMGGLDGEAGEVVPQLFDPETGTWTLLPTLPIEGQLLDATVLPSPTGFLVFATRCGNLSEVTRTSDVVACDPAEPVGLRFDLDDGWRPLDLPAGEAVAGEYEPHGFTEAASIDGSLALIAIDDRFFTYEPDGDRWTPVDAPPIRYLSALGATCITAQGIARIDGISSEPPAVLEDDGTWATVPPPVPSASFGSPLCTDRSIVVDLRASGVDVGEYELDLASRRWTEVADRPTDQLCESGRPIDGGGVAGCGNRTVLFDATTGAWAEPRPADADLDAVAADGMAASVVTDAAAPGGWRIELVDLTP